EHQLDQPTEPTRGVIDEREAEPRREHDGYEHARNPVAGALRRRKLFPKRALFDPAIEQQVRDRAARVVDDQRSVKGEKAGPVLGSIEAEATLDYARERQQEQRRTTHE